MLQEKAPRKWAGRQRLVTYRNKPKRNDVDVDGFNGKRMHLTKMNEVVRSKNDLVDHFNEENRLRMGWQDLVLFY